MSLADLASVKRELQARSEVDLARRQAEAAAAQRALQERRHFALSVGPVTPLASATRRAPAAGSTPALPRQRERDEQAALAATLSDDFDPGSLLDSDAALGYARDGVGADVLARLRRDQWSIQRHLDLHGLRRDDARNALVAFLHRSARDGLRCVRIVHGKGNGSPGREPVLKAKVRSWLVQRNEVMAFAQACAADGGHGALLVLLR